MLSRRDLLKYSGQTILAAGCAPLAMAITQPLGASDSHGMRCINVINFIRAVEPRFETDLLLPVRKQMELVLQHQLPATWLLQFDALVSGPFVSFLKVHMADSHEVGFQNRGMVCFAFFMACPNTRKGRVIFQDRLC
jgi:hypothetical protein